MDAAENSQQQRTPRGRGRGRPFRKGVSGNPGGRPRVVREVRDLAQSYTEDAVGTLVKIMRDRKQPAGARVSAAEALLDRGYGRAPQAIALTPLPYVGEVTVSDPIEAARVYEQVMGGALAIDAVRFDVLPSEASHATLADRSTPAGEGGEGT